jgi:peptidoglycan hydrolase-like protein with peptidoglycan-binding domain
MSIVIRRQIMTLVLSALCGLASYQPAWAGRNQDYNAEQFVSVLNGLGYPVALGTPLTDARVQQALRDFQLQYKLPVDGQMNFPSQDQAADTIRNLQRNLNLVLNLKTPLPLTQFYGPQTEEAVKLFQKQQKLPSTGIATLETRQKLAEAVKRLVALPAGAISQPPPTRPPDNPNPNSIDTPSSPSTASPTPSSAGEAYPKADFPALLQNLGYDIDLTRPLSDPPTQTAIRLFQNAYGLAINGQADRPTLQQAATVVKTLRNNLKLVLKLNLPVIAAYDADTIAAVKQFQSAQGLQVDGIATPTVRQKIDAQARQMIR